jgi:hypothetical protein
MLSWLSFEEIIYLWLKNELWNTFIKLTFIVLNFSFVPILQLIVAIIYFFHRLRNKDLQIIK